MQQEMMFKRLFFFRGLIWDLVKRDFFGRYKGSVLGVAWSLLNPLIMLAIYTVVFGMAFKTRWGPGDEDTVTFALVLFSGLIVHGFFAENLNRAPSLITTHANYVKKVVFPLEILPVVALISALIQFSLSFMVLLLFCLFTGTTVHAGTVLIPLILLPLILITLGLSWFLASIGTFLRDLAQGMSMITTLALFLAPVFYPIGNIPKAYHFLLFLNPITLPVVQMRDLMLWGNPIEWSYWFISLFVGLTICFVGYWWFQNTRKGFADVL
jgi:lipopolysaccharide transport system permease protein